MSIKRNFLVFACILFTLAFVSCDKVNSVFGKFKGSDAKIVTDDNGRLNINHEVTLQHVSFDDDSNGFIIKREGEDAVKVKPIIPENTLDELYYTNGVMVADSLENTLSIFKVNPKDAKLTQRELGLFLQGVSDYIAGKELDENYLIDLDRKLTQLSQDVDKERSEFGKKYFESISSNEDIIKTESGLMYKILEKGNGEKVPNADTRVNVDYIMNVYSEFEENKRIVADQNSGVDFAISQLIPGVVEGMQLMSEGDRYEFYVKPELGYGDRQVSAEIKANSYLIFDVKINKILKEEAKTEESDAIEYVPSTSNDTESIN